jgi:outer membrane protein assembly factor BamB
MAVRRSTLVIVAVLLAGGMFAGLYMAGHFRSVPRTRIAQRTLYSGPTTLGAVAEDWPAWRGPRGDQVTREVLPGAWPAGGPKVLWSADVGLGYSSPVAAGGRVYVFSLNDGKEALTAFDANSGQIVWSVSGGEGWTSSYVGTRATPAVDGDRIYTYGGRGELLCRGTADGATRWRVDVLRESGAGKNLGWGSASSPLVAGNLVYVQGGDGGSVAVAVDKMSGKVAWKSEATGTGGYAHPVLADVGGAAQLIVFGGTAVYGMDPASGRTLWQYPWRTSYDVNASTPIVRDGRLFVTSEYDHGCAVLQLSASAPPSKVWENNTILGKFQGAILDGDYLYANSSGTIVCVAWADGTLKWTASDARLRLGPGGSMVRGGGDKLLTLSERGKLSLARATQDGITLIGQGEVVEGKEVWATPVVYGGRVYVKGGQEVVCLEMGGT